MNDLEKGGIATVIAVIGGLIARIISKSQRRMELEFSEVTKLRKDLGQRYADLQEEVKVLRKDLEHWQTKYYTETMDLKSEVNALKLESGAMNVQLRDIKNRKWIPESEKDRYE